MVVLTSCWWWLCWGESDSEVSLCLMGDASLVVGLVDGVEDTMVEAEREVVEELVDVVDVIVALIELSSAAVVTVVAGESDLVTDPCW